MSKKRIRWSNPWVTSMLVVSFVALGGILVKPQTAAAHNQAKCVHHQPHRTAQQTIEQHLALMQSGKMEEAFCDYAEDAVVIMPGQTIRGRDEISKGLLAVTGLLGSALPNVHSVTATGSVVMITFSADGFPCTIPDGSDTYIVEHGQIVAQTVHDTFYSAEGATCPAAAPGE
jgi:ketosteroid isomerase-like protein